MANDTEILSRGTVRDSLNQTTGEVLAYTVPAVFTTNEESVLEHRFDYDVNPSDLLPYPEPAIFSTTGYELSRRTLNQTTGKVLAYTVPAVFATEGNVAARVALPVLHDSDDVQIMTRGGAFVIAFYGEPLNGLQPHEVQFTNNSQSPVDSWTWLFGDGQTSNEKNPSHIYVNDGDYDVTLIAGSSVFGYARLTKYDYVIVGVRITMSAMYGKDPLTVRFRFNEIQAS